MSKYYSWNFGFNFYFNFVIKLFVGKLFPFSDTPTKGDERPRRSKRIQEIEAKKENELKQLEIEQNSVDNTKCARRSRSKSVASERPNRRPLFANSQKTTPAKTARQCDSVTAKVPSNGSARRSMFDNAIVPSRPNTAKSAHRCNRRTKSTAPDLTQSSGTPAKSNLKTAHRCSARSKSVSFEGDQTTSASARQQLVASDAPIDLSVQANGRQSITVPSAAGTNLPTPNTASSSGQLPSDMRLDFENRIGNLVDSNMAKISRIKELMAENRTWKEQYDTLNRINQSLVATVDAMNVDSSIAEMAAQKIEHEQEMENLRVRINRLNRENFDLRSENERLKFSLATHSKQISGEHNYNCNFFLIFFLLFFVCRIKWRTLKQIS